MCLLNKFKHLVGAMLAWRKSQLLKPLLRVYRKVEQLESRRPHKLRRRCLSCWLLTSFAGTILPLSVAISMRYHRWTMKVVEQSSGHGVGALIKASISVKRPALPVSTNPAPRLCFMYVHTHFLRFREVSSGDDFEIFQHPAPFLGLSFACSALGTPARNSCIFS